MESSQPSVMVGLHIYSGKKYFGQVRERVGPSHWLVLEPDGSSFIILQVSDLRTATLYKERKGDS